MVPDLRIPQFPANCRMGRSETHKFRGFPHFAELFGNLRGNITGDTSEPVSESCSGGAAPEDAHRRETAEKCPERDSNPQSRGSEGRSQIVCVYRFRHPGEHSKRGVEPDRV